MKILFLNHNVKGIGTCIRCFNFAKHMVRFGHSVVLLTSAPQFMIKPKKEMIDGVEVVCMPDIMGKRFRNGGLGPIDTILRCLFLLGREFDIVENFDHRPAVLYPALVGKYLRKMPVSYSNSVVKLKNLNFKKNKYCNINNLFLSKLIYHVI